MNKRFEALDAFRGICAISVVLYHMNVVGTITELSFFQSSDIFVEFFFILSGFVLAHGYAFRVNLSLNSYCKSRFFRIYPLHLFMLFFFISIEILKLIIINFGGSFSNEPFTGRTAFSEIIPNLLLLQSWSDHTEYLSFNGPSWSISIEFYMYFIFILTVLLLKQFKILSWALASSLAFILIYLNLEILTIQALRGISCFFGGAFIYTLYKKTSHIFIPYLIGSIFEVSLIIVAVFTVQSKFELKPIIAPMVFLITVLLFSFESGYVSKALKIKPLQLAGKLSYSIYMTHTGILFFSAVIALILKKIIGIDIVKTISSLNYIDLGNILLNNLVVFIVLAVVVLSSNFTYKYIELNGIKLGKKYV